MAAVGAMLWSHLLRGHGVCHHTTFYVTDAVVVWPWWASCCGCVCCMAAVCVIALHFVLRVLLLRGHSGHCVAVAFVVSPQCVLLCRIVSQSGLLRGHHGHCVAVAFVV